MKFTITVLVSLLLASCGANNNNQNSAESPEQKSERVKSSLENLMKCETCSVGLQSIVYLDSLNKTHSENAYAVLDHGNLIYFTVEKFHVVSKDQIISYATIRVLRFDGHPPKN